MAKKFTYCGFILELENNKLILDEKIKEFPKGKLMRVVEVYDADYVICGNWPDYFNNGITYDTFYMKIIDVKDDTITIRYRSNKTGEFETGKLKLIKERLCGEKNKHMTYIIDYDVFQKQLNGRVFEDI